MGAIGLVKLLDRRFHFIIVRRPMLVYSSEVATDSTLALVLDYETVLRLHSVNVEFSTLIHAMKLLELLHMRHRHSHIFGHTGRNEARVD